MHQINYNFGAKMILNWILNEKNAELKFSYCNPLSDNPEVTIIMPVFDQSQIIENHIYSVLENATSRFAFFIVDDCSNDNSLALILDLFERITVGAKYENLCEVKIFSARRPWHETRCDDFLIRQAKSKFIIGIQADMKILETGFDSKLVKCMKQDRNIFSISARGVHNLELEILGLNSKSSYTYIPDSIIIKPLKNWIKSLLRLNNQELYPNPRRTKVSDWEDLVFPRREIDQKATAGWLGDLHDFLPTEIEEGFSKILNEHSGQIWFGETVMRGPLILDFDKYIEIGGLNTKAFFQGNDDHDLSLRANQKGWLVGFTPIHFSSPVGLGNTRRKRKLKSKLWSKIHKKVRRKYFVNSALFSVLFRDNFH
jgi:glycosyltransferase involved in cell wall biosynthesis